MDVPEGWSLEDGGKAMARSIIFKDFAAAFAFLTQVAMHAEKHDHHPDFCVSWNRVDFKLATHSSGRLTERDLALAEAINALLRP